jgi:hypothetical protein
MQPRSWKCFASLAVLTLLVAAPAFAAGDANGTWEWTINGQNGQTFTQKAKLKQDGEKLTGVIMGRNNQETEIKDGKVSKDGELSFAVTRERNGQSMTTKYTGKLDGDKIKGKMMREGGQGEGRDWEAKRSKDEKKL